MVGSLHKKIWRIIISSVEVLQHNFETIKPDSIFTSIIQDEYMNKSIIDEIRKTDEFKFELSCLQVCDLISLVICREKELGGKNPPLFLGNTSIIDYKLKKIDKSVYKVSSELFSKKENLFEIPYKQIELDLLMEPKKLKKKYIESEFKFRKIYFVT